MPITQKVYVDSEFYTLETKGDTVLSIKDRKGEQVLDYRIRKAVKAKAFGRYTSLLSF